MRQICDRVRVKYPRSYKIISKSSNAACNVCYWSVCMVLIYGYLLQYSVTGNGCNIDK